MNIKQAKLAARRAALIKQIADQRGQLSAGVKQFQTPLSFVDKGVYVYRYLTRKPVLLGGIAALVAATRPKRWLFLLENSLMIWQLISAARRRYKQPR